MKKSKIKKMIENAINDPKRLRGMPLMVLNGEIVYLKHVELPPKPIRYTRKQQKLDEQICKEIAKHKYV